MDEEQESKEATETSHDEKVSETPGEYEETGIPGEYEETGNPSEYEETGIPGEYEETGIPAEAAAPETSRETPQPKAGSKHSDIEHREKQRHMTVVRLISPEFQEKTLVETSIRVLGKREEDSPRSVPSSVTFATPSPSQHGGASSASEREVPPSKYETDSPSPVYVTFNVPPKGDEITQDNLILLHDKPQVQEEEDTIDTIAPVELRRNTRQWRAFSGLSEQIKKETQQIELLKESASRIIAEIKEKIRQQQEELEASKMGYRREIIRILNTLIPDEWVIQGVEDPLIMMLDHGQSRLFRGTTDSFASEESAVGWMGPTAKKLFGKQLVRDPNTPYHVLGMYTRRSWDVPRKSFGDDCGPCSPHRMSTKRFSVASTTAFTPASSSVVTPMRQSCGLPNAPNVFPPSFVPHAQPRTGRPPRPPGGSPSLPLDNRKSFSLPRESSLQAPQLLSSSSSLQAPKHTARHVPSAPSSRTELFQCDNISKNYSCQFPCNPPIIYTPPPVGYPSTAETGPHEPPEPLENFLAEENVEFIRPFQSQQMSEVPSPPGIIYPEKIREVPSFELFGIHPFISLSQATCPPCLEDFLQRTSDSTMGQAGKRFHKWVTNGVGATLFPCCCKEQNVRITEYWEFRQAEKGPLWVFRGRQIGPVPSDLEEEMIEKVVPSTTQSRNHCLQCQ